MNLIHSSLRQKKKKIIKLFLNCESQSRKGVRNIHRSEKNSTPQDSMLILRDERWGCNILSIQTYLHKHRAIKRYYNNAVYDKSDFIRKRNWIGKL